MTTKGDPLSFTSKCFLPQAYVFHTGQTSLLLLKAVKLFYYLLLNLLSELRCRGKELLLGLLGQMAFKPALQTQTYSTPQNQQ